MVKTVTKKDTNLNYLKGRLAENMIQQLFIRCGFNIFDFGLERLYPQLSMELRTNNEQQSQNMRWMPDFVVQAPTGDLFHIEVKYRSNGWFEFDKNYEGYPYHNAFFIIVSPNKIQCLHVKQLDGTEAKRRISDKTNFLLSKTGTFKLDPQLVEQYEQYAKDFFMAWV